MEKIQQDMVFRINDVFWTIQGEGFHNGRSALFLRLPFCNYSCPWCDTEYNSYEEYESWELDEICNAQKSRFAVITGGEPLMNKQVKPLIDFLKARGFEIATESNGSMPYVEGLDFVTVSPKRFVQKGLPEFFINPAIWHKVSEFKYVVDAEFDFAILDRHKDDKCLKSLSPEFNDFKNSIAKILEYVKENPEWKISLQTHKWMQIP